MSAEYLLQKEIIDRPIDQRYLVVRLEGTKEMVRLKYLYYLKLNLCAGKVIILVDCIF